MMVTMCVVIVWLKEFSVTISFSFLVLFMRTKNSRDIFLYERRIILMYIYVFLDDLLLVIVLYSNVFFGRLRIN